MVPCMWDRNPRLHQQFRTRFLAHDDVHGKMLADTPAMKGADMQQRTVLSPRAISGITRAPCRQHTPELPRQHALVLQLAAGHIVAPSSVLESCIRTLMVVQPARSSPVTPFAEKAD